MQLNGLALKKASSTAVAPFNLFEQDVLDPVQDFDFLGNHDYSSSGREKIMKAAQELFGAKPENEELNARLTEYMLSVSASRKKIASELVLLGGSLFNATELIIENHIAKTGHSTFAVNQAKHLAYKYFDASLGLTSHAARKYMRCFEKFGEDNEAVQMFNIGELNILSAPGVTDDEIDKVWKKKLADPKMTQDEVREFLNLLRKQDQTIQDKDKELDNVQSLLEDSKDQLRGVEADSKHLRRQLAELNRALQEQQKQIQAQSDFVKERTSGLGQLQKDYQDKVKDFDRVVAELAAAKKAKTVETQEVIVEKVPEGFSTLTEALKDRMAALEAAEVNKQRAERELEEINDQIAASRAQVESESSVQQTLAQLISAWEGFAAKFATAQLAVQASTEPTLYTPTLKSLSAMLRKCLSEVDGATRQ
ncbi:hypothetical protein LJR034_008598 [Caballeronia sp. LjRoot34]|uniref:hypothetical protein n=1 Tax=Caballeronia sp. LjRoot34 TaxID=3342325 RepID=UPI003ECD2236